MINSNNSYMNEFSEVLEKDKNYGYEDRSSKCKQIEKDDPRYKKYTHCSHVMIYTRTNENIYKFPSDCTPPIHASRKNAIILMLMRSDGYIGFPGGFVEEKETPAQTVCRKLKKQLGWSEDQGAVSEADYQFTYVDEEETMVMHFYATEVTKAKMDEIEKNLLTASDFGTEVLGHFRIPLQVYGDAFRGFPSFLKNHFAGDSKLELLKTLMNLDIFDYQQLYSYIESKPCRGCFG